MDKAFHITTSFEVIEHIPRSLQPAFWQNVIYLSDYHLCSIHTAGGQSKIHQTLMGQKTWTDYFEKNNIEYFNVGNEIKRDCNLRHWQSSIFFILKLPQLSDPTKLEYIC